MCGIVTILGRNPARRENDAVLAAEVLPRMLATLNRRGPDETTMARLGSVWFGHTRLSIIDLQTGSQPLYNESGTVAAILNGEIYNFRELRDDLRRRGHNFRSASDTEVLVHLYEEFGEDLFRHLNGMFAAVVYDSQRELLLAGRDRLGEKPVLYLSTPDHIVIASELKALLEWPGVPRTIDRRALAMYLNMLCVPEPLCIFEEVSKLQPAHFIKVEHGTLSLHRYWTPVMQIDWSMDASTARERVRTLLQDAVRQRMVADVPLGIFLSGGIDSSAVTAFAAEAAETPVRTYSVGLAGDTDERPFARAVAARCGAEHTELFVRADVAEAFPCVMDYFDEPFADSSSLPTFMVSREARAHVKVALTGDGGDELFGGYTSYLDQARLRGGRISTRLSRIASGLTGREPRYCRDPGPWSREHWRELRGVVRFGDLRRWLPRSGLDVGQFYDDNIWLALSDRDPLSVAFEHDLNYYLPADLLKKVDMAAMLASLECRAPFLDHRLVEFCMTIPPTLKLRDGQLKWVLKDVLSDRLPREVIDRPKHGFGAPINDWVRGPLREIAADLLHPGCRCESLLESDAVRQVVNAMQRREPADDWRLPLQYWSLLALEWWMRRYA